MSPNTTNYVESFAPYVKAHTGKSIAIFHGNDAYGTTIAKSWVAASKQAGLKVTDTVSYKTTALTFHGHTRGDPVHAPGLPLPRRLWPPHRATCWRTCRSWVGQCRCSLTTRFSVSPTVTTGPPTGQLGTAAEKNLKFETFTSGVYRPITQEPKNVAVMLNAMKRQGTLKSSLLYGYWYDAIIMGSYAARAAKTTTTGPKLAKAIQNQKPGGPPTGVFPAYHYSAVSHSPNVPASSFELIKPSKLVNGLFGAPGATG